MRQSLTIEASSQVTVTFAHNMTSNSTLELPANNALNMTSNSTLELLANASDSHFCIQHDIEFNA